MGFFDPTAWAGLFTVEGLITLLSLSVLEIVLGIDNIIFISIVAGKLPKHAQKRARMIGLSLALIFRII
jgi:predicted tellurium resistance membrane protein TerC